MDRFDIRYAWNGDTSLAYLTIGEGPVEILYLQGYLSNVLLNWEHPACERFLQALASRARLTITDRRGLGVSERFTPADTPPIEVLMDDVEAVRGRRKAAATGAVRDRRLRVRRGAVRGYPPRSDRRARALRRVTDGDAL